MDVFDKDTAAVTVMGPVDVARWEQFPPAGQLPFGAMWYSVAPGSSSAEDRHPDVELSLVLSGDADVEAGGVVTRVSQGSAFLLAGDEPHVVHNPSPDTPLRIFSAYWMPGDVPPAAPDA